jgi:GT2 family glycosyltransferase
MIDASVVIVNWNTKDLLLECIRTTLEAACERTIQIIVVDNASTDGSVEAVRQRFPSVKVLCNDTNLGFAKANNIGIRAGSSTYVCLVNSDIEVLGKCIDTLCSYMDEHSDVGLLGPQILNKDLTLQRSCSELPSVRSSLMQALMLDKLFPRSRFCRSRFMTDFDHRTARHVKTLSGCFLMARRAVLNQIGLLDERFFFYAEDVDLCKRFHEAGWRLVFYPAAKAIHYGGASSAVASGKFLIEMERANLQYWHKHSNRFVETLVAVVMLAHYGLRITVWAAVYLFRNDKNHTAERMISNYATCLGWLTGLRRTGAEKGS